MDFLDGWGGGGREEMGGRGGEWEGRKEEGGRRKEGLSF